MITKIKVKPFNNLPEEDRTQITFYTTERVCLELKRMLDLYRYDISPRLRTSLLKRIEVLSEYCDSEYEVEE